MRSDGRCDAVGQLDHAQGEVEEILTEKNRKLAKILDNLAAVNSAEFNAFLVAEEFTEAQQELFDLVAEVEQVTTSDKYEYERQDFEQWFVQKDNFINMLDERSNQKFDAETFQHLQDFVKGERT